MADVRSLLKSERAARRIQHKYASYSSTGSLLCTVCHLQLKSETLWDGHLRSAGHTMRAQKVQEMEAAAPQELPSKKRKANDEGADTIRKKAKPANGLPEGFFDAGTQEDVAAQYPIEMQIPSRPATPSKPVDLTPIPKTLEPEVNEDEWASFQADIASAEAQVKIDNDAVISAPAMSAADVAKKMAEEEYTHSKERQEAEMEGDKEDAARKMEDELEEMESLEARVKRLREKREELRRKESVVSLSKRHQAPVASVLAEENEDDGEDDEDDEDDDWDGFRLKG